LTSREGSQNLLKHDGESERFLYAFYEALTAVGVRKFDR
jgi:hypothetical protein